jgi:hypothetical protein
MAQLRRFGDGELPGPRPPSSGERSSTHSQQSNTCPQILGMFGSSEFYDEKIGPDMTDFCLVYVAEVPAD